MCSRRAENFVLYVLLEAIASGGVGGGGGNRLPLNLGVVIDRSGSMYDERRLEFVIEAVKFLADNVAPDDKVAVVAFADKAQVIIRPDQIHDKNAVRRALEDIDLLEIGGGTQMALGMRAAIDEVKQNLAPNRLNRVLVLTDGQTYEETACIDLANQNRDQMSFSAMGVGVEFNEKLLMRIAQDSHGKYHFIGDPAEIPGIFEDELQGLRAVSVRNGRIEVTLSQGVQVREAFRASPEIYTLGAPLVGEDRKVTYEIGDLEAGRARLGAAHAGAAAAQARTGANRAIGLSLRGSRRRRAHRRYRCHGRIHARPHADQQAQRPSDEPGRSGFDRETAVQGGRGTQSRQRRSRHAALGNAIQGTQRLGNIKATQALVGLMDQVKKTQTLQTKAAKTTLLQAQAVVRKTQMLDPEALKDLQKGE